jgi:hypothetical protein
MTEALRFDPQLPQPADTRAALASILAKPEYQGGAAPAGPGLLERIWDWLTRHLLGRLVPRNSGWLGFAALGVIVVLLVYIVFRLVWEAQIQRSRKADATSEAAEYLTTDSLLAAANQAAARGDFRTAIRLRFRALLTALDLPSSALLTNWQLARQLTREHPGVRDTLRQLVQCFEDAWYGGMSAGQAEFGLAGTLAERVLSGVREVEE